MMERSIAQIVKEKPITNKVEKPTHSVIILLMNEFDIARKEIERIRLEAEQRRIGNATAETQRKAEEAAKKEAHATNLALIIKSAPDVLKNVNQKLFDGKGSVDDKWRKRTSKHINMDSWDDGERVRSSDNSYTVQQSETRLEIPHMGDIVIFIVTQKQGIGHIAEEDRECFVSYTTQNKGSDFFEGTISSVMPLSIAELTSAVTRRAIRLYKEHYSDK